MADIDVLDVRLHGQLIGALSRLPDDRVLFTFRSDYVENATRPTLSLSFKDAFGQLITEIQPTRTRLPTFFSNLLPEGSLRDYLAARAGVKPQREFFLLGALGLDLPGALQILPAERSMSTAEDTEALSGERSQEPEKTALRFSLAGVQLKLSAVQKATGGLTVPVDGVGGSWIVKLPSAEFEGVPENEFAMMELARRVGIDVPETKLIPLEEISGLPGGIETFGDTAFAIKRFDRTGEGTSVHMEDFAQVFRVYPDRKYEKASYRNIVEVLWIETGEAGVLEFMRRMVFSALIGNADMHLKNWSLVYPDRRTARLSPAYDFVSTIAFLPDDRMALTFADSKAFSSLTLDQVQRFTAKAGLPEKRVLDSVKELVAAFSDVWRNSSSISIDEKTRQAIDRHLKTVPLWKGIAE